MSNLMERKQAAAALVEKKKNDLLALVGNNSKKFEQYKAVMIEFTQNKSLVNCSIDSIILAASRIIQLGLNPNPLLSEAYVIARGVYEKQQGSQYPKKVSEVAELQIGVKGYKILGFRSGWEFSAQAVYICDQFRSELGEMEPKISLIPNEEERDEENPEWVFKNLKGVITFSRNPAGNISKRFIPRKKLEKIRLKSPTQYGAEGYLKGIWKEWSEEMYIKSALKYFIKREPVDSSVMEAIIEDEKSEREEEVINVEVVPNASPKLKKGKDIASSVKSMGLSLYPFEGKAVVDGNTFNSASLLKDLGFACEDGNWFMTFNDEVDLIEACLPTGANLEIKDDFAAIRGEHTDHATILNDLGFSYGKKKHLWFKKMTDAKAA